MHSLLDEYEMNPAELGVYIQPIVQGTAYHCEFNLFFVFNKTRRQKDNPNNIILIKNSVSF